ncbi:MAG: L-threonylcarbamoyladenylate synthase [Maritimibacter sp.]
MAKTTEIIAPDETGFRKAAGLLRAGGLVAMPTETVYGLAGDACDDEAVARIFEAKARPTFNPLIIHLPDVSAVSQWAELDEQASTLAAAFWPGPLTMVLPIRANTGLSSLITAGLSTVAVRVPAHESAKALLRAFGGPLAAPSANPSGKISPTTAAHVLAGLDGKIDAVLDAGPCNVGVESTIIGLDAKPTLLRPGGLSTEDIEAALGAPLQLRDQREAINAPGQLASHYAPKAVLRLNALATDPGERLLGFGDVSCALNLSPAGDLVEAAANLFRYLHQLDETDGPIAVSPIPDTGLGRAINDRLRRAAAPRP